MSSIIVQDIQGIVSDSIAASQPSDLVFGTYYREDGRLELDSNRTIPAYGIVRLAHIEFITDSSNHTEDTMKVAAITANAGQKYVIIGRTDDKRYCFYDEKESELARTHYKGCHCTGCNLPDDREDTLYNGGSVL